MADEQMMEDQMGDDAGMASGAPTPLTALEVRIAVLSRNKSTLLLTGTP